MNSLDISREYEEKHIVDTMEIVVANRDKTRKDVDKMKKDIDSMWDQYFAGDTEIWVPLHNTMAMHAEASKSLSKFTRASSKPYFGRILFTDRSTGKKESLYIGRCGINKNLTEQAVADWRAPISNIYYENGLGECGFLSPDGDDIELNLELKRTYDIDAGKLIDYVDSEVVANDELLTKYLAKNKQAVLGEIIATIQKEQNDIIRKTPFKNVIVQGAAGSGKTTVAMHRISYILYNYAEKVSPSNFFIIGSNKLLLNYITGVLPELDVEGVSQMTMEEMFAHIIGDVWDEDKYKISSNEGSALHSFEELREFCDDLEKRHFNAVNIVLNRDCFVEGLEKGRSGIYDRAEAMGTADYLEYDGKRQKCEGYPSCVMLMFADFINRFIKENPALSLQQKVLQLEEHLKENIEYEFSSHSSRYTEREKAAIKKYFRNSFGPEECEYDIFSLYDDFLEGKAAGVRRKRSVRHREDKKIGCPDGLGCNENAKNVNDVQETDTKRGYDVYDLAALAYIFKRVVNTDVDKMMHHIVIDEAQDYGISVYKSLDFCYDNCTYTIMGDISQNIRYDSGLNSWDELKKLILTDERDSFCTLRKSYRNTVEISEFATGILDHGNFDVYPVEPIIRHGDDPEILNVAQSDLFDVISQKCREWQSQGHMTVAVVCRNDKEAKEVYDNLSGRGLNVIDSDAEKAEFGSGIMVLPVALTKGLEFDAVLLFEPDSLAYPVDDRHAKLLYVAATRALHELCVVCSGEITGLISEPVEEGKRRHIIDSDPESEDDGLTPGERLRRERKAQAKDADFVKNQTLNKAGARTDRMLGKNDGSSVISEEKIELSKAKQIQNPVENSLDAAVNEVMQDISGQAKLFASAADDSVLKPAGHAMPSLSAKWITVQNNGIYIQSRYGILRICPISSGIIRFTFCAGSSFKAPGNDKLKEFGMLKNFTQRQTPKTIEIGVANLSVTVDKLTGAVVYKDSKGKELIKEKAIDTRFVVPGNLLRNMDASGSASGASGMIGFTSFMPKNNISFHAYCRESENYKYIGNSAMYVTNADGYPGLVMVKDSFAIMPVSPGEAIFDNRSGHGIKLITEGEIIDYYFIKADNTSEIVNYYGKFIREQ